MMKSYIIEAKSIRNKEELNKIPKNMPGFYKWWAPVESLEVLLNSKYISKEYLDEIKPKLTKKKINNQEYYYIYVGVAIKESIHDRLNWHVNQHHTESSVTSGFLSTLRQSLSSLVVGDQYNEIETNKFIDTLIIEYYPVDLPIKSSEASNYISSIEINELNKNTIPINLKDNNNSYLADYLKELKRARKNSK